MKIEAADMQTRIEELEKLAKLRGRVHYQEPSYWETIDEGREEGPFCQRCWDADARLMRLQTSGHFEMLHCHGCKSSYDGPRTKALEAEQAREMRG